MDVTGAGDQEALVRRLEHDLARAADPFRDARVVIVDDEPSNVELLGRLLELAGISTVHGLTDPRRAVDLCLTVDADLLLLDLHMPNLDGHAVLRALGRSLPADDYLPVLVLSGDTSSVAREQAFAAGAKDFVTKPFDRVEVLQRVRNLLEARALYRGVRRQNQLLRAELDAQAEQHRSEQARLDERRASVADVLGRSRFRFVFQPIVDLRAGRTVAVEALARFAAEPQRGPGEWFAEAADVGLGAELELAAARGAMAALDRLPREVLLSVNVSPDTVASPAFFEALDAASEVRGRLVTELTEHHRVRDHGRLVESLAELRHRGVLVAVDDAGAGYSGLQRILSLRPDIIKLDVDLTRGIDGDPVRRALASSLVRFAGDTAATLVAEGIETAEELDTLRELGVGWGQGYFLAEPGDL